MESFLGLGLDLPGLLILIAAVVAAVVVIKLTVTFDLNRFMEARQAGYAQKLRNACTHLELSPDGSGRISARSLYISPPGTLAYMCQRCGLQRYLVDGEIDKWVAYYGKNIDEYFKMNKRFHKLLKKSGQI